MGAVAAAVVVVELAIEVETDHRSNKLAVALKDVSRTMRSATTQVESYLTL